MRRLDELNGHEFEQALGAGEGQGSLACCSPWGCKELDMTEQRNNNYNWHIWECTQDFICVVFFMELKQKFILFAKMNHLQEPPCILLIKATSPGLTFKIVMYLILEIGRKHFWRRQWQPSPLLLPGKSQ